MATSTLTSKGQITLPQDVRRALSLSAGDKVDFVPTKDGFKLVPLRTDVRSLKGRFAGRGPGPASIEDMDRAIAMGAASRQRS